MAFVSFYFLPFLSSSALAIIANNTTVIGIIHSTGTIRLCCGFAVGVRVDVRVGVGFKIGVGVGVEVGVGAQKMLVSMTLYEFS
jgi:hypothetical protein